MKHVKRIVLCGIISSIISLHSCKKDGNKVPESKTFYGDAQPLGNGTIRSFVVLDKSGTPQSIGMKFTAEALSGLPADSTVEHDTPVPPAFIPLDYVSGVQAVPDMGVHWIDMNAPEFNGQKFTDTFIYGFYHSRMTFMEPMATAAFISSKPDFKIQIKQPLSFQKTGYYPTVQHLYFDASSKEYTMVLEGLKFAEGKENN